MATSEYCPLSNTKLQALNQGDSGIQAPKEPLPPQGFLLYR